MPMERVNWGGLDSVVVHRLPQGRQPRLVTVLCHGFGAPGTDLVGLAQPLLAMEPTLAESVAFVFPAACLALDQRGIPGGLAWWMIDLERLIYGPTPEVLKRFRCDCPDGLPEARAKLLALLADAEQHFGISTERFVLGGFSQGAMLATDVALRLPKAPAALGILSGGLINEGEWTALAKQRGSLTVLQSHGRYDSILPYPMGVALRDLLLEAGAEVDFLPFNGDHEIPLPVVERLATLLKQSAA